MPAFHNQSKTVWIFNQYINKPEFPGGTRHYDLAKELTRQGYRVHLFGGSYHYLLLKEIILNPKEKRKVEELDEIFFHWLRVIPYKSNSIRRVYSMVKFYFSLLNEVNHLKRENTFKRPDIIIGSSVHLFTVMAAYQAAKKLNSRFIMEVRDLWPYTFTATGQMSKYHPLVLFFGAMERFLYRKAERIISLLEHAADYIGQYTNPEKVIWIPNSFNKENLSISENVDSIAAKQNAENLTLLFAGSMNHTDNIPLLVNAYHHAKMQGAKINLVLIGDGMEKSSILQMVKEKKITDVLFLDSVPKNRILSYLKLGDFLWAGMPDSDLYKYGLSFNKLYDYMAAGKPIILSSSKHENIVTNANCGVIAKAENENDLANKILEMIALGQEQRKQLGANGYNYLMNNFTSEIIVEKLIKSVFENDKVY